MTPRGSSWSTIEAGAGCTLRLSLAAAIVLGIGTATSCDKWAPEARLVRFELRGAHTTLACESCHGPPPFVALPADCLSCHETDRKDASHYPGQTCAGGGCHSDADLTWGDVGGGGVIHDFLPLETVHALPCTDCHALASPPAGDLDGQAELCWNCHETDRLFAAHYVEDDVPPGAEARWDCNACHPAVADWADYVFHACRTPHGTVSQGVANSPATWVTACADCHPADPPAYVCSDCHLDLFAAGAHHGALEGDDGQCLDCHEFGDYGTP